jgi:hypothetical protein
MDGAVWFERDLAYRGFPEPEMKKAAIQQPISRFHLYWWN